MRQVLLRISLEHPWAGFFTPAGEILHLGACWILVAVFAAWLAFHAWSKNRQALRDPLNWIVAGCALLFVSLIHRILPVPSSLPLFGYGMMVLLGVSSAIAFAVTRGRKVGIPAELILDSAFWVVLSGVAGGRLAFVIQYHQQMFDSGMTVPQVLFELINLSGGGLVLIGALVGGAIGVFGYFTYKKLNTFEFADLLIPSVFIGVGFGRIGCLLNGCCYGDRCELPWAIQFAAGTEPFKRIFERGFLPVDAIATMPLHPTQIYSSLDGFLLAAVTAIYFWYRRHPGDGLAVGCILYSITRFMIEFLRSDEMGQLGTGLTISQLYSIGILAAGVVLLMTGPRRGRPFRPFLADSNQPVQNLSKQIKTA